MASMMPKQLAEFLQEQQEPFILEVYLLESGHHSQRNRLQSSECGPRSCSTKAKPCSKRSVSWGLKRNRKFIPTCSKVVRTLFSKLLTVNNNQKLQNSGLRHQNSCVLEKDNSRREIADENFSSASSTTVFNSCSESDAEDAQNSYKNADILLTADHCESSKDEHMLIANEVAAGWKFRWKGAVDSKQFSPISVLDKTEPYNGSPVEQEAGKTQKQLLKSVSKCKSEKPICSRSREVQDFVGSNFDASSHYSKNKAAVQQTKQFLFDCTREVVEKHKRESRCQQFQRILRAEQLWELMCENICLWSKESINETNVTHLLHSNVLVSAQEWTEFGQQTQAIGFQLGDAILEDISNEIITEMVSFCREK